MATVPEAAVPSYEHEDAPSYYGEAPSYEAALQQPLTLTTTGANLTLDPTGTFVRLLSSGDARPLYTLNKSMLKVSSTSSIHVKRVKPDGEELTVWAIGEHFIDSMHTRKRDLQSVTVARSHGLFVDVGLRRIVWDFSTRVPAPPGSYVRDPSTAPVDPVYMIGTSPGPGTIQKHLFQFYDGKWVGDNDEVVALEREAGPEVGGMPVLSVMKELDVEMIDFLVSAWLVTMWGEVAKRARRHSKSDQSKSDHSKKDETGTKDRRKGSGSRFSMGMFKLS